MSSRPLHRIQGLNSNVCKVLQAAGIRTVRDVLLASSLKIMLVADLSIYQVSALFHVVAEAIVIDVINLEDSQT
jgi:hypothetical protein